MLKSGLVSITFRELTPKQIVDLVAESELDAIEWGGDLHVPHGDIPQAEEVRMMTQDAGLISCSYGSYFRLGQSEQEGLEFFSVLDTAEALGVTSIRVWAGNKGAADADDDFRKVVMDDAVRIADLANKRGIKIAFEYHGGTLTDTNKSAHKLLQDLPHNNITTYWQPPNNMGFEERLSGLKAILPRVSNIHVFHWSRLPDGQMDRRPLAEGTRDWQQYLQVLSATEKNHFALMEFVRDGEINQFRKDAATLKNWLSS